MENKDNSKKIAVCGENCASCERWLNGDCPGCVDSEEYVSKRFPAGKCKVHSCAKEHHVSFCGMCSEYPCGKIDRLVHWSLDAAEDAEKHRSGFGHDMGEDEFLLVISSKVDK